MFCILGEVGTKLYVVVLGPFALDSSCATLLAQINVAHRKLCNNLVFLSLEASPNLLEIYDASTYKSCQFIALYLKKKKGKKEK